jgi:predicted nucleic acid-binding protein
MDQALLDTDIFSEVLKGRNQVVRQRQEAYLTTFGHFTLSTVTVMEMIEGLHRHDLAERIADLCSKLEQEGHELLPFDYDAAQIAGRIFANLHRTGQPIGRSDPMIAAIAIRHSLVLVTGNTEHFERIQRLGFPLRLDNWRS